MEERIQKLIASAGLCSRRKAEELICAGRVRLNGNTAHLGDCAELSEDVIEVDGVRLKAAQEKVYLMLSKPRGFVTTAQDEKGRRTVLDLVRDCPVRVYPVGRLDLNSEGLLLLTNDGEAANCLMHPKCEIEKTYLVWVTDYSAEGEQTLRAPMVLDGYRLAPAKIKLLQQKDTTALLEMTIHEGRNRQIRRMCEQAGLHVTRLKRIREGSFLLGDLPSGSWRYLTEQEVSEIERIKQEGGNTHDR